MNKTPQRRTFLALLAAAALPGAALAQEARRPTRIVVGFPPGGTVDQVARLYAEAMRASLGASVIVENRSGAGGQIAADAVRQQPADGSTLLIANNHMMSTLPLTTRSIKYDPINDFEPVSMVAAFEVVLVVSAKLGVKTFHDYVEAVRRQPQNGSYGIPAPGSLPQFIGFSIGRKEHISTLAVPYQGAAPIVTDLLGNNLPAAVVTYASDLLEFHRAGKLRILASSGPRRLETLPDVPTFAELGYAGMDRSSWMGLFAPKGTPRSAIDPLNRAIAAAAATPRLQGSLKSLGLAAATSTPDQLRQAIRDELATWAPVVKDSGYSAD